MPQLTRPSRNALAVGAVVVAGYVLLGAFGGWLWEAWWQPPSGVVTSHGWSPAGGGLEEQFAGTALFAQVGAGVGLVAGVAATWWLRRRELLLVPAVTLGAAAATATMLLVGTFLGPGDPAVLAQGATPGTTLPAELDVRGTSPYLVLPAVSLTVVAVGLLLFTGSRRSRHEDDV